VSDMSRSIRWYQPDGYQVEITTYEPAPADAGTAGSR